MNIRPLYNYGSNCYINSALQGILSCPTFSKDISLLNYNSEKLSDFKNFIEELQNQNGCCDISNHKIFSNWKRQGHQDSLELLLYLLNEVYNDIRKCDDRYECLEDWIDVQLPLKIRIQYLVECNKNHITDIPLQCSFVIHLPIVISNATETSVQSLLNLYLESSEIDDFKCSECGLLKQRSDRAVKSTILVAPLPHTLCLHLQRAQTRPLSGWFPWTCWSVVKATQPVTVAERISIIPADGVSVRYRLQSMVVHIGGTHMFGHYVCYRRDPDNNSSGWVCVNDTCITAVLLATVLEHSQPYLLFYEQSN